MLNYTGFKSLLVIWVVFLAACSPRSSNETISELLPTDTAFVTPQTPSPIPAETEAVTAQPPATTVEPTLTATTMASPTPMSTLTPETLSESACPSTRNADAPSSWFIGSVLLNMGMIPNNGSSYVISPKQPGIWAISANQPEPQLVNEALSWVEISPDGKTILSIEADLESSTQEAIFYNITNGSETHLSLPLGSGFAPSRWLPDGRFQYTAEIERTRGVGERRQIVVLDPSTQQIETVTKEYSLPNYFYDLHRIERELLSGYDAVDPTDQLALYTAFIEEDDYIYVRLLNHQTGEILWEEKTGYPPETIQPEWTTDGSSVLFSLGMLAPNSRGFWDRIVSLTPDGQEEELPRQPFSLTEEYSINNLTRSPDGRYIFYSVKEVKDWDNIRSRGFIIDTLTGKVGELCNPEAIFVTALPGGPVEGWWLPDSQFLYRVQIQKEGQPTHSLRLLDIATWTTEAVFEAEPGYGVNVFGWTPMEFPR